MNIFFIFFLIGSIALGIVFVVNVFEFFINMVIYLKTKQWPSATAFNVQFDKLLILLSVVCLFVAFSIQGYDFFATYKAIITAFEPLVSLL